MAVVVVFVVVPTLAALAGYVGGTTAARAVTAVALGPLFLGAWAAYSVLSAPTTAGECDLHHCADILGHWTDPLTVILPALLAAVWVVGALFGIGARRLRSSR